MFGEEQKTLEERKKNRRRELKKTQKQRERKHEREVNEKIKKSSLSLCCSLRFCFSLSLSLVFFFGSAFFGSAFSLSSFSLRSVSFPLFPGAILMNYSKVFRKRHFAPHSTRACTREKKEREKETRERERARKPTLFTDGSFSLSRSFSPPLPRGIKPHRRNIPFSRLRRKTENSRVFPGKPSS